MCQKRILKPVLALTLAVLIFSVAGSGQTREHDLSLQMGFLSSDQVVDIAEDVVLIVISLGSFSKEDMTFSGVPFLTYHYSANSKFGFGGAIGYFSSSGDLAEAGGDLIVGDFRERNYIGAVEVDYHWIMKPGLQLYSGAGFGLRIRTGIYNNGEGTAKVTKALPTFHLNAIGVRFGRKVGFFAECGIGYKGVLAAGVNAQF